MPREGCRGPGAPAGCSIQHQRAAEVSLRPPFPVQTHFRVAEVGQSLRVLRLAGQFGFELTAGFLVALLLPVEVTQAEMGVWRHRRGLYRSLELRGGRLHLVGRVERLA